MKAWFILVICAMIRPGICVAAAEAKAKRTSAGAPTEAGPAIIRKVLVEQTWREAEVFVVLPKTAVEMSPVWTETPTLAKLDELAPSAAQGGERTFSSSRSTQCRWKVPLGNVKSLGENRLGWEAPTAPRHYRIVCEIESQGAVSCTAGDAEPKSREWPTVRASTTFHFLVPYEFDPEGPGVIQGYPIGAYPNENAKEVKAIIAAHRDRYRPPRWFVAITSATRELHVSEHVRLCDFVPHAAKEATVYFPYNANLCRTLEAINADLGSLASPPPHLRILRGFVSPYDAERLRRLGARLITFNRYQYGDGVLVVANSDGGEKMGDLNRDGKVDARDAETLANIINRAQKRIGLPGWVGVYGEQPDKTLPETPMVGFDVRGWWAESFGPETPARNE